MTLLYQKMINNFELISNLIDFTEKDGIFMHTQVIRRGKDHPDMPAANRSIKTYYIQSKQHLMKVKDEIINLCELFKARAYINVTPKHIKKLATLTMSKLAERIHEGDYKKIHRVFESAAGELKGINTRFLIDIDDISYQDSILEYLNKYFDNNSYLYAQVPTKNGIHLISKPFYLAAFKKEFPNVEVHKNNPTILYIPKSLDNE